MNGFVSPVGLDHGFRTLTLGVGSDGNRDHLSSQRIRVRDHLDLGPLVFRGSLYETVVKQPCLSRHAAARWHYGRGPSASDEHFTVPLAISNNGAREGIVVSLAMTVERPDGGKKDFAATFTDLAQDSG